MITIPKAIMEESGEIPCYQSYDEKNEGKILAAFIFHEHGTHSTLNER